jgi:general nucleoside transport system permease protein
LALASEAAILTAFLVSTVRMAAPLLLASLGEIYAERSGLLNPGLEGMMLFGAFGGFVVSQQTGSPWLGLLGAIVAAVLIGMIFAYLTVSLHADQVVTGVSLNLVALGLATFSYRLLYGVSTVPAMSAGFSRIKVPFLADIPVLGPVLFQQSFLVYLAYLLVPVTAWSLWRTNWGLRLRACGESPLAALAEGVPVRRFRYVAMLLCGVLAGAAGAFLTLDQLNVYVEDITAGRGFIGLAIVIFGRWRPAGAALAALLFGAADALGLTLQVNGVKLSHNLLLMLPYVLTVIALVGMRGRAHIPAALGKPFRTE